MLSKTKKGVIKNVKVDKGTMRAGYGRGQLDLGAQRNLLL